MPAFPNIDAAMMNTLFSYLGNPDGQPGRDRRAGGAPEEPSRQTGRPVAASGGAPGGLELPVRQGPQYGRFGGPDYPEGADVPPNRYYSSYGTDYPYIISPPWSSIVAYDLNRGAIKWKVPLGEDAEAAKEGAKNTGMLRGGEHHGIVVTSTGLVFVNSRDGKIRAFDEDDGKVLWSATLPAGTEGIPAMYEVNGRQYLVVPASSPLGFGRQIPSFGAAGASSNNAAPSGYVAFALPK